MKGRRTAEEPIHKGVHGNEEGDNSDGGLEKLLQLAMLSVTV